MRVQIAADVPCVRRLPVLHGPNQSFLVSLFLSFVEWCVFFFNDTATTEIYTLSLHDALPISVIDYLKSELSKF